MADALTSQIRASLSWNFQDTLDATIVKDESQLSYDRSFVDGVAADQADKVWHDIRTLAVAANDDLDLNALTNTIFGSTITINFAKIKGVLIMNMASTAGEDLLVGGAAAQAWSAWVGAADDRVRVPADSCLLISSRKDGLTVTNGASDTLRIANAGTGSITYRIAVLGTSS